MQTTTLPPGVAPKVIGEGLRLRVASIVAELESVGNARTLQTVELWGWLCGVADASGICVHDLLASVRPIIGEIPRDLWVVQ